MGYFPFKEEHTKRYEVRFAKIESKWQKKWADADLFAAKDNSDKPKFYGLVEFPYPSGAGMHVGHYQGLFRSSKLYPVSVVCRI